MTQSSPNSATPAASPEVVVCAHCAASLAGAPIVRRAIGASEKSFCCLGCAFIFEQIYAIEARGREPSAIAQGPVRPVPIVAAAGSAGGGSDSRRELVRFSISGMVCSACAALNLRR